MKKILFTCLLSLVTVTAAANTCPPAKTIFVPSNHGFDVVAPPGWKVTDDTRAQRHRNFIFRVAAWGNHKKQTDSIRCHYYADLQTSDHIQIDTIALTDKSHVASWGDNYDPLYALCVSGSDNVNECSFI